MTADALHIDFETRSAVDLKKAGQYVYFDDPSTDVWCAAYSFGTEEPRTWLPGQPCPPEITAHVVNGGLIFAWNAAFERLAWRQILGPRYGWPVPRLEQYRCVMAQAYALGMPGALDNAAGALGLPEQKDQAGYRLMLQMSRPRTARKGEDPNKLHWWDDAERLQRLVEYCKQDVKAEIAAHERMLPLRDQELQVWFVDQRINDRGVYIDKALCDAASKVVEQTAKRLDQEMKRITDHAVRGVSNVSELIGFVRKHDIDADSVAKDQIVELLVRDDLPPNVRRALEIRQEGSKTSTAKINAMLARRQSDGRGRGNLQYHGAGPGRWAARGIQLQNLPRPSLKGDLAPVIDDLMLANADYIEAMHGPALSVVSDCLRGMIAAPPGRIIRAADFASIEARMLAWLTGEETKLDVFRRYDAKQGPDPYCTSASAIFNEPVGKNDPRRQTGKVAELALGYQGGPGAFAKMAKNYNLDIGQAYEPVWERAPQMNRDLATDAWDERGKKTGMARQKWIAAELIKLAWRQAHPNVVQWWSDIETAAIEATDSPGTITHAGEHVRYRRAGSWLFCRLPSGRAIAYAYPRVEWKMTPWGSKRPALTCMGVDGVTKKWERYDFYGGLGAENIDQGASRDVMAEAMLRAETMGYEIILTVHDELVSETERNFGSVSEFGSLVSEVPAWAPGLPVAAEAWEGSRYKK